MSTVVARSAVQVSKVATPFDGATNLNHMSGVAAVQSSVPSGHCVSTGTPALGVGKLAVKVKGCDTPAVSVVAEPHSSWACAESPRVPSVAMNAAPTMKVLTP